MKRLFSADAIEEQGAKLEIASGKHLTAQIAEAIMESTQAEGVCVVIECRHLCSMMRGAEKQNSVIITSSVLGSFLKDHATRQEFMALIGRKV